MYGHFNVPNNLLSIYVLNKTLFKVAIIISLLSKWGNWGRNERTRVCKQVSLHLAEWDWDSDAHLHRVQKVTLLEGVGFCAASSLWQAQSTEGKTRSEMWPSSFKEHKSILLLLLLLLFVLILGMEEGKIKKNKHVSSGEPKVKIGSTLKRIINIRNHIV